MTTILVALLLALASAESEPDCTISSELRVTGKKTDACVERLETAARLARAELRVNAGMRRKRK